MNPARFEGVGGERAVAPGGGEEGQGVGLGRFAVLATVADVGGAGAIDAQILQLPFDHCRLAGQAGFDHVERVDGVEQAVPIEHPEDLLGGIEPFVGGDMQRHPGLMQVAQHAVDAVVGRGFAQAAAVVGQLEGLGQADDGVGVRRAAERFERFLERRADDVGLDTADRTNARTVEGLAEARQDGGRRVDQGAVEIEDERLVCGHGINA